MNNCKCFKNLACFIFLLGSWTFQAHAQGNILAFESLPRPIIPFDDYAGIFPADFNNDGDYDVLTFGAELQESGEFIFTPYMLWNDGGGNFSPENISLGYFTGVPNSIAFLDFNNDNAVDIALSADFDLLPFQTLLLANNGNGSFSLAAGLNSVDTISPHGIFTLDFDNDGDTDILVRDYVRSSVRPVDLGYNGSFFENKGNGQFELGNYFSRLHDLTILDVNKDGRMDIVKTFQEMGFLGTTYENLVLLNQGGYFSRDASIPLPADKISDIYSLDVNGDKASDLYIRGSNGDGYVEYFMMNEQGNGLTQTDAGIHPGLDDFLSDPAFTWSDINSDNLNDLLITFRSQDTVVMECWTQDQDSQEFDVQTISSDPPLFRPDTKLTGDLPYVSWFDANGDNKVDAFFGLRDHVDSLAGHVFRNIGDFTPRIIPIPSGLSHFRSGSGIVLEWKTEEGMNWNYNVRVGTSPGGVDVVSPLSDPVSGFLRMISGGNAGVNDFFLLDTLAEGRYYWSVQAISAGMQGGAWAQEQSFIIGDIYVDFEVETVCLGQSSEFNNTSLPDGWELDSVRWDFGDGNTSAEYSPVYRFLTSGNFEVTVSIYTGGEMYSSTKEVLVKPSPEADFTLEDHCLGQVSPISNLSQDNGSGINYWNWDFDDGTNLNEAHPLNHGFVSSGTYNVRLKIESGNGCADSLTRVVNVLPPPQVDLRTEGTPCVDSGFSLSTIYSPAYQYQWKFSGGNIPGANQSIYVPQVPGTYSVVVNSPCGELSESLTIPEPSFPVLAEGTPCKGNDYRLSMNEEGDFQYKWYLEGAVIDGAEVSYYYPREAGEYEIHVTTSCGEYSGGYTVELLGGLPVPEIIVKGPKVWILVCSNDTALEYRWYLDDNLLSEETSAVVIPGDRTGSFRVEISDGSECFTSSAAVRIPLSARISVDPFHSLKIYPNPTPGVFNIEMDNPVMGDLLIDIFTEQGSKVINIKFLKETNHFVAQVDLSGQSSGLYFISLALNEHKTEAQIVIE
ncbi:MAG: PKD domain-containing protein [Bacteroidota bacterium]